MAKIRAEDLSWIKRGRQRREIIVHIADKETPTEIAQKSKYSLNHTSKILNEFRKHGFVKLLNPKQKTGRLYELTEKGRVIKDKLRQGQK